MKKMLLLISLLFFLPTFAAHDGVAVGGKTYFVTGLAPIGDKVLAIVHEQGDTTTTFFLGVKDGAWKLYDTPDASGMEGLSDLHIRLFEGWLGSEWLMKRAAQDNIVRVGAPINALLTVYGAYHVLKNVYALGCHLKKKASQKARPVS